MSTYMPKEADLTRNWYLIDAEGKTLGEVAVKAATILRGKHKPTFAYHADCGENVVVINCAKVVLTGKKLEQKKYYRHSGYIGNLKEIDYKTLMEKKPEFVVKKAIKGMLPDTVIGRNSLRRLRVYAGPEHEQTAQQPVKVEL